VGEGALHRPAIGAHRLLGDGRSAALLRPDGEVDWWCAPDVDSPPLLWSLLDAGGAAARWQGARLACWSGHPAGRTATTVLRVGGRRVEVMDGLLEGEAGPTLVRLARCAGADLDVVHELAVSGFDADWGSWDAGRSVVDAKTVQVAGGTSSGDGRWLRTVLRAPAGRWAALVVAVGADTVEPDGEALAGRLAALAAEDDASLAGARLPASHPERAADALRVLEACTYRPTGAVVAAPTTSLPEAPGADRQFDYRYSWVRDASLAISVASLVGRRDAAGRYLAFARGLAAGGGAPTTPCTDVRGEPVPAEREVGGVAGWAGSRPIRVGNAAAGQVQHDSLGLLAEAVSVYLQTGGRLDHDTWDLVRAIADQAAGAGDGPSNGIWERRDPQALVSADIGRWLALDRAVWIARGWRPWARRRHWRRHRDAIRERVLGALLPDGGLPQSYGGDSSADASSLMVVIFGMLGRRDPRAARLVDATLARLGAGPFLYRYEPGGPDGFSGVEGAFVPVSWWAVAALAAVGRVDEAGRRADEMCAALPRLLSEEVDPGSGESLGNVPLVWSHAEAARAMYLLDAARLRSRYGAAGLWAWRIGRYVRLRCGRGPGR